MPSRTRTSPARKNLVRGLLPFVITAHQIVIRRRRPAWTATQLSLNHGAVWSGVGTLLKPSVLQAAAHSGGGWAFFSSLPMCVRQNAELSRHTKF